MCHGIRSKSVCSEGDVAEYRVSNVRPEDNGYHAQLASERALTKLGPPWKDQEDVCN